MVQFQGPMAQVRLVCLLPRTVLARLARNNTRGVYGLGIILGPSLQGLLMPKIDVPAVTNSATEREKRWVFIPENDIFEYPFPHVRINNNYDFGPGKHFVDPDVADTIEDRVAAKQKADIALMRHNPDMQAVNSNTKFGSGRQAGGSFVNPKSLGE
jgi:hypothetical protein